MEHLLFLIIEFVLWIDRCSLRPLKKLVPNLSELRNRPATVLAEGDLSVGPLRRWGSGIALGLLLAAAVLLLAWGLAAAADLDWPGGIRDPLTFMLTVALFLGVPLLSIAFMLHVLRGGRLVLRRGGVEFHDRGTTIVCPWPLFNADGKPFQPSKDRILVPVQPAAVALVESHRDERLLAQGSNVRSRALAFKSANLAELRGLYQVEVPELAELLLHLGRHLGTALPKPMAATHPQALPEALPSEPPLVRQADGWMRVSLVHLTFPPYCCDCGARTAERKPYQGHALGVRVGRMDVLEAGDFARIEVPLCGRCQDEHSRTRRKAVLGGVAIGFFVALFLTALLCLAVDNASLFFLVIPLGVFFALIGAAIGGGVGKAMASPVRLRRYAPSDGTILMWFRNAAYGEALVEILGGVVELTPDEESDPAGKTYSGR